MLPDEIGQRFPKIFAVQAHPAALILKGDSCRQRRVGGCLFNGLFGGADRQIRLFGDFGGHFVAFVV